MTNTEALIKIAKELQRMNDLKELEIFLNHKEWTANKYANTHFIAAELLHQNVNEKLENGGYSFSKKNKQ